MSRNNKLNRNAAAAGRLPPSHPLEHYEEHRAFLIRSLERNDKEIAALVDLTRSIRSAKKEIIEECGELTLLDLGSGKIRLALNGKDLTMVDDEMQGAVTNKVSPEKSTLPLNDRAQELCVDFLLRLKLRRKLLSRLFRRVNRVAHAMDGIDVSPPVPPRYGDLRLHIEPSQVEAYHEHWKRQQAAIKMMEALKEQSPNTAVVATDDDIASTFSSIDDNEAAGDAGTTKETNSTVEQPKTASATLEEKSRAFGYGALVSFDDEYEKIVNPETGDIRYAILDRTHEEDYIKIKSTSGIGATHHGMSAKDKETEFVRWQTAILNRIPEQPTYADLGLEHRVFFLEKRRKRALEAAKESPSNKRSFADDNDERPEKGRGGKSLRKLQEEKDIKEGKKHGNDKSDTDVKQEVHEGDQGTVEMDEKELASETEEAVEDATDKGRDANKTVPASAEEEKKSAEEVVDNTEAVVKRTNPISLQPVPSFYDQDLKRIRTVHRELLASSILSHSRQRLELVIRDYNQALRLSQDAGRRRQQADSKLQQISFEIKREQAEYDVKLSAAHGEWMKRLNTFNNEKLNKAFKSRWNQQPQGTVYTSHYGTRPEPIRKEVALCAADLVDAVERIVDGQLVNPVFNERFMPPPNTSRLNEVDAATGQVVAPQKQRIQSHYRKESDALAQQFRQCEEERQRAWRRMLKVKSELNVPQLIVSGHRPVQMPVTDSNYHIIAMPNVAVAGMEVIPRELDATRAVVSSYVPMRHTRGLEQS
ncbi:hypothetical protein MPSEU_000602500 [Mayamaea pseudoterrestris]|nr:hypothetical protein MPSEU_000602500 [Mayamaea pseudoterrestris]